jgi:acetyl esterase/lipase
MRCMSETTLRLWDGKAPGAIGDEAADVPMIKILRPPSPDGSAIVVCPGGGYGHLAPHESEPIARWLNATGITGIVLTYRLAPRYRHPAPLQDVSRAIRTVRARAKELELDPKRIGVLGFSAGGHLSATISTKFDDGDATSSDPIERVSSRPDVSVLCYPVITFTEISAHTGSRKNLLGPDATQEMIERMSAERHVTPRTPPAFLFHTVADQAVPVENSLLYAAALRKSGVPYAMHLYEKGKHGVGLAENDPVLKTWPKLCSDWLASHGFGWADKNSTTSPTTRHS